MFLCPNNMFPHWKSSGTCTHLRSSGTHTPSHPVPEGSTVNRYLHSHLVPTLHVIWYSHSMSSSTHSYSSGTRMFQKPSGTKCSRSSGTNINNHLVLDYSSKIWHASRGKSGTWVLSRTMSTCGNCVIIHPYHTCGPPAQGE
jgi:hypothetical protein